MLPNNKRFYSNKYQTKILKQIARKEINKNVETKQSVYTASDGQEIRHNDFITLDDVLLKTTPGPFDPNNTNADNRIGDDINLRGVSIKFMTELNERYSDVTFRVFVIKCAKGDVPTRATMFNGLSGNKMIDTLNTERYTILASKTFKMKAPNFGGTVADGAGGFPQPSGYGQPGATFSRATRIVKMWIPGKKFVRSGVVRYEQGSAQPKFFDYRVVLYAYSNYTTLQDSWYVGRLNDYVKVMYYKDA